jgi:hypothetical protein
MTHRSFIEGEQAPQPCLIPKTKGVSSCDIPGCKACFLSKEKNRRTPGKCTTLDAHIAGALKRDDIVLVIAFPWIIINPPFEEGWNTLVALNARLRSTSVAQFLWIILLA